MKQPLDPLYAIFERYLLNSYLEEESHDEFINKVVGEYISHVQQSGMVPSRLIPNVESELKEEVLEMLRKKIYGHFNLKAFRESQQNDGAPGSTFKPRPKAS